LAVSCWLLAVGCWLLAVGCWPLAKYYSKTAIVIKQKIKDKSKKIKVRHLQVSRLASLSSLRSVHVSGIDKDKRQK